MTDYFNKTADLLGLPRPPAVSMVEARTRLTPGMLSFIEESRRIDNCKMREELGVEQSSGFGEGGHIVAQLYAG